MSTAIDDEAATMERLWQDYAENVLGDASPAQILFARRVFYTGMYTMLSHISAVTEVLEDEQAIAHIQACKSEMEEFFVANEMMDPHG